VRSNFASSRASAQLRTGPGPISADLGDEAHPPLKGEGHEAATDIARRPLIQLSDGKINCRHAEADLGEGTRGGELRPGGPAAWATTALVPKISKTTPCKVAWRSPACAIPPRHLTRRANHLQYSIITPSAERKPTWQQRRGDETTRRLPPQHRRSSCTPRPLTRVTSPCNLMRTRQRRVHRIPPHGRRHPPPASDSEWRGGSASRSEDGVGGAATRTARERCPHPACTQRGVNPRSGG
jgi:hypothetical protein